LGISTLEAITHGIPPELLSGRPCELHAALDAQRRELFVGRFQTADSHRADVSACDVSACQADDLPALSRMEPDKIVAADQWLANLAARTVVSGAAVSKLRQLLPSGVVAVPDSYCQPRA